MCGGGVKISSTYPQVNIIPKIFTALHTKAIL